MNRWAGIARLGGIGDNLVTSSVLRPLKQLGYMTEVITSDHAHEVFLNNPFLDKLSIKRDGEIPGGEEWFKWFKSRSSEYDIFANLSHSMEVLHALQRSQTAFTWRPEYRRQLCAGSYLESVHDIVGVPHIFGPLVFPTEEETARALQVKQDVCGGPYVVWVLSGSRVDKIYQYSGFAIARIIRELDIPVMMMGVGEKQAEMAKQINAYVGLVNGTDPELDPTKHKLSLAISAQGGQARGDVFGNKGDYSWPLRRSLAQILQADLVVTVDTGLAWAVAMEPIPKIMLHSHASVENICKHWVNTTSLHADPNVVDCWPCHQLHDSLETCRDNGTGHASCIADISVEVILQKIEEQWALRKAWASNGGKVVPIKAHA